MPISKMIQVAKDPRFGNTKALLLFETPQDALAAIKGGVDIKELNIGSMAHSVGKVAVSKVLSLGKEDVETLRSSKSSASHSMSARFLVIPRTTWMPSSKKQKLSLAARVQ